MKRLIAFLAGTLLAGALTGTTADTRVYELRTYYTNEGKLDALHARFRHHTLQLFAKHGMENIGYWVPVDNPDQVLIYLLAYPSRAAREASWQAFMADPDWQAVYRDSTQDGRLVKKVDSLFLEPTDYTPPIMASQGSAVRLFELRTYHANEGKLADLHRRFRNHTVTLFAKHDMTNFGYWRYADDQAGAGDTMIYLLAFPDAAARDRAWQGFRQDPDWQAAARASEVNGKLVGKVDSVLLKPTDYSPTK